MSCAERLQRVLDVALPARDIIAQRVNHAQVPTWCEARGWAPFLLALSEAQLREAEAQGLGVVLPSLPGAPASLQALAGKVLAACELPRLAGSTKLEEESLRSVRYRKRAQLSGLLSAVAGMAEAAGRIVDVGAGSGHFTRLSAQLFERDAIGLECNPARVASARKRSESGGLASFVSVNARDNLAFAERDLAIGLHACGEFGNRLVEAVGRTRCDLALVSCCLQKISSQTRPALSSAAADLELLREHLGLTNLTAQPQGVEASIDVTIQARQTRYALGQLLRARGVALEPGAEMAGIDRRRANQGLRVVAERALLLREMSPLGTDEVAHFEAAAAQQYGMIRRLSLPRSMLSRLLEVLVSLDRAVHLEERGLTVRVATLFERGVSPRNIGIFASLSAARLPAA